MGRRFSPWLSVLALGVFSLCWSLTSPPAHASRSVGDGAPKTPKSLFDNACAACHGVDGSGAAATKLVFEEEVPDFTDCQFASREPDADWFAVAHAGGPVRVFSQMMPAFGAAVTEEELNLILEHVRTFCDDDRWPAGEHNLPKPLHTEKAFPEDEAYARVGTALRDPQAVDTKIVVEKRIGQRSQFEFVLPLGVHRGGTADDGMREPTRFGIGDIAVGLKHTLFHSKKSGSIFAMAAELKLPTGHEERGFGKGTVVLEPFVAYGQEIPVVGFIQAQVGGELPFKTGSAKPEVFWRVTYGRSFDQRHFGRVWTPMVEVLGKAEFEGGGEVGMDWDIVPQFQVTLSKRQHVMLNVGCVLPLTSFKDRQVTVMAYLLWDWFDGGFLDGWR